MKKRLFIGLVAVLACGGAVLLLWTHGPEKAVYHGKPLRDWCIQGYHGNSNALSELKSLGTNAIPGLLGLLKTRDSALRKTLWSVLPKLPRRARPIIVQRVAPPTAEVVREAAARSLGLLGPGASSAVPALARALREKKGRVRQEAALALGRIGKSAVPELSKALADESPIVRQAAASALAEIGPDAESVAPALAELLNDPVEHVRNMVAYGLSCLGTNGVLALVDAARQGHGVACEAAAQRLGQRFLSLRSAWPGFLQMAKDPNPATRLRVIEALALIPSAEGLAMKIAFEALDDPAVEVRLAAIKTLGSMGSKIGGVLPGLPVGLRDESPAIREWTAWALGQVGPPATNCIPELNALSSDAEPAVRMAAARAIKRISQMETVKPERK